MNIETAPKDGTLILGIINLDGIVLARTTKWVKTKPGKYNPEGGYWTCPNTGGVIGPFTHWMKNPDSKDTEK
jgi:hypothetical protein